jgi:hypothetical protein
MTETTNALPAPAEADEASPVSENPAVARCCNAYARALQAARGRDKGNVFAKLDAEEAYRKALPPLYGHQNICDFIACVAHGMLIDAINGKVGARLLYAAQVAHTTNAKRPGRPKSGE